MITFNGFVHKHNLKNKATSNIKIQKVLTSVGLDNDNIYLRDGPFSSDIGIVNLHPSKGTHWVCYINENYFDSYGIICPKNLSKFIIKETDIAYILNIKSKKLIVFVQVTVYIKFI